jgi:hypothetical protein
VSFTCPSYHPPAWKQSTALPRARARGGGLEERRARGVLEREVADLVAGLARAADDAGHQERSVPGSEPGGSPSGAGGR